MEESWRGADHTQTSWGAADRCHESTAVIGAARMEKEERPELRGRGDEIKGEKSGKTSRRERDGLERRRNLQFSQRKLKGMA